MPRPRFESLPAERRAAILRAAAGEIAEQGIDGVSYNRIIERTGVSKGAMYYYFDDKADLLVTTLRDAYDRAALQLGPAPDIDDAHGYWNALDSLYTRITDFVVAEPDLARILQSVLAGPMPTDVGEAYQTFVAESLEAFEALLRQGVALGAVRDDLPLDVLARLAFAVGEVGDRWSLSRWESLDDDARRAYSHVLLSLHLRLLAPLPLVVAREGAPT